METLSLLPPEIMDDILSHIALFPKSQINLNTCAQVSRSWYRTAVVFLYDDPKITGKNYNSFVKAICPSVNAHIRHNGLSELVRRLDMSALVHNGSKSMTARLLGRVKGRLEEFVAPQASFAYVLSTRCRNDANIIVESIVSQLSRNAPIFVT